MTSVFATLVLAAATAQAAIPSRTAAVVDATDPEAVRAVASGFGSATLTKDSDGDPMIEGRINGVAYRAFFFLCDDGKDCKDVLLWAGWEGYDKIDIEDVNRWNQEMRFGTAYIDDEGDPCLQMVVNLNHGVSTKNLDDTFDWWASVLRTYVDDFLENDGEFSAE